MIGASASLATVQPPIRRWMNISGLCFISHKGRYGSPRLVDELNDNGIACSENRVARRMQTLGLQAVQRKKFKITTDSEHDWPVAAN